MIGKHVNSLSTLDTSLNAFVRILKQCICGKFHNNVCSQQLDTSPKSFSVKCVFTVSLFLYFFFSTLVNKHTHTYQVMRQIIP
jgi:hypothetical protein